MTATLTPFPVSGEPSAPVRVEAASAPRVAVLDVSWKNSIGCAPPSTYVTPGALRTAWIWALVAFATTTPIALNSPFFAMPAADTACRAAVIEVPCTITDVFPVRPVSWAPRKSETLAGAAWSAAEAVPPAAKVAEAARTLAVAASRDLRRTWSSRGVGVRCGLNEATCARSRPRIAVGLERRGQWRHDRVAPQGRGPYGTPRGASAGVRRTPGHGPGQAARRQARRGRAVRCPAAHRRAALPHAGRAQGRGDEVRPGAERPGVRAAGGAGRALPRAPHRAAGLRAADADRDRARAAHRPPRRRLAPAPGLARRCAHRGRLDRPGPPRPVA